MQTRHLAVAAAALGALAAAPVSHAQTWVHDTAGIYQWNNPTNWSTFAVPVSGISTQLTFGGATAYVANNNLPAPFRLNRLILSNGGQSQITGNALQFEMNAGTVLPQIIQNGSNVFTINSAVVLNADTTLSGTSSIGGSIAFGGAISGSGALNIAGGLAVSYGRLGGPTPDATFTGGTRIFNGGMLDLWGDGGSTPAFGAGAIQLNNGTLTVHSTANALWVVSNALRIDGTSIVRSGSGSAMFLANDVTLNGTLICQPMIFGPTAQVRIDNGTVGHRAIYPIKSTGGNGTGIYASIVDANNVVAPNALYLRPGFGDTLIAGTANIYVGGTIIEASFYSSSAAVEVDEGSSLGGGNVVVQPQARLRLDAVTNLAPGKTVLVQQGGAVEFNEDTMLFNKAAIDLIDPASTGILLLTGSPAPGLSLAGHEQLVRGTLTTATLSSPYVPGLGGYRLVTQNGGTLNVQGPPGGPAVLTGPYSFTAGQGG